MRASDAKLAEALREAGLETMARQAEAGDYNEFFGPHGLPLHELRTNLEAAHDATDDPEQRLKITTMMLNVINGHFDATKGEAEEWMRSEEGQRVAEELRGE